MNWIARRINIILLALIIVAPFAIMTGCQKQSRIEIARVGQ